MTPEDLAFQAGWRAGYECGQHHPTASLTQQDTAATADWQAWKRETAEPLRCVECGDMIMQGARCELCRKTEYRSYGSE